METEGHWYCTKVWNLNSTGGEIHTGGFSLNPVPWLLEAMNYQCIQVNRVRGTLYQNQGGYLYPHRIQSQSTVGLYTVG